MLTLNRHKFYLYVLFYLFIFFGGIFVSFSLLNNEQILVPSKHYMNLKKKIKQNILTNLKNIITIILPNQDKILITPTQEQSSKNTHTQEYKKIT